jgi:hypothetical protein
VNELKVKASIPYGPRFSVDRRDRSIRVWCYLRVCPGYEVVAQNTKDPDIRISTSRSTLFHLLVDASPPGLAVPSEGSEWRERLNEQSHRRGHELPRAIGDVIGGDRQRNGGKPAALVPLKRGAEER